MLHIPLLFLFSVFGLIFPSQIIVTSFPSEGRLHGGDETHAQLRNNSLEYNIKNRLYGAFATPEIDERSKKSPKLRLGGGGGGNCLGRQPRILKFRPFTAGNGK